MTRVEIINVTLGKLDEEYVQKVMVYANTLLEIQEERKAKDKN